MSSDFITQNKGDKELSFKQLVLEHQRRILQISSREFTKTDYTKTYGKYTEYIQGTDNALNYIQAVESFASILSPFFDDEMIKIHKFYSKFLDCWDYEFKEINKLKIKEYEDKEGVMDSNSFNYFFRRSKIRYAKQLFMELNKFLYRVDYLKGTIYREEDDDPDIIDLKEPEIE